MWMPLINVRFCSVSAHFSALFANLVEWILEELQSLGALALVVSSEYWGYTVDESVMRAVEGWILESYRRSWT